MLSPGLKACWVGEPEGWRFCPTMTGAERQCSRVPAGTGRGPQQDRVGRQLQETLGGPSAVAHPLGSHRSGAARWEGGSCSITEDEPQLPCSWEPSPERRTRPYPGNQVDGSGCSDPRQTSSRLSPAAHSVPHRISSFPHNQSSVEKEKKRYCGFSTRGRTHLGPPAHEQRGAHCSPGD